MSLSVTPPNENQQQAQEFRLENPASQRQKEDMMVKLDWMYNDATTDGWGGNKDALAVEKETVEIVRRALTKILEDQEAVPSVSLTEDGRIDISWGDVLEKKTVFCTLTDSTIFFHFDKRGIIRLDGKIGENVETVVGLLREALDECF